MAEHTAENDAHDHDEFDPTCETCATNVFLPRVALRNAENDPPFAWVDKWTHEPCPARGKTLCTITDPAHRHMAAHMVPPLTLTVRAGTEPVSALGIVEALGRVTPPGVDRG